jgi:hypothetical protein
LYIEHGDHLSGHVFAHQRHELKPAIRRSLPPPIPGRDLIVYEPFVRGPSGWHVEDFQSTPEAAEELIRAQLAVWALERE